MFWIDDAGAPQLFWLMGGGGTGKSVLSAEFLRRTFYRTAAWHFCRHDNKEQSSPASLLRRFRGRHTFLPNRTPAPPPLTPLP